MRLHQNGHDLAEVRHLEQRASEPAGGLELLWFHVASDTPVENDAPAELVGDTTVRITVVDYHPIDGLVVALAVLIDELHAANGRGPPRARPRRSFDRRSQ